MGDPLRQLYRLRVRGMWGVAGLAGLDAGGTARLVLGGGGGVQGVAAGRPGARGRQLVGS